MAAHVLRFWPVSVTGDGEVNGNHFSSSTWAFDEDGGGRFEIPYPSNSRPIHTKFHGSQLSWWKTEGTDGAASRINKNKPLIRLTISVLVRITGTEVKIGTWSESNDFGLEED